MWLLELSFSESLGHCQVNTHLQWKIREPCHAPIPADTHTHNTYTQTHRQMNEAWEGTSTYSVDIKVVKREEVGQWCEVFAGWSALSALGRAAGLVHRLPLLHILHDGLHCLTRRYSCLPWLAGQICDHLRTGHSMCSCLERAGICGT